VTCGSSVHSYARWKDPKSLARVWTCSRHRLSWNPLSGNCSSMARLKTFKLKRLSQCLYLTLSIGMSYYQEGCNISELTKIKGVNWKYGITIFKDWRSTIKNHLIRNLPLQFNHKLKLVIAIRSDIENLSFNFNVGLNCNGIYPISWIAMAYLKQQKL
jgi:hypothetical protein